MESSTWRSGGLPCKQTLGLNQLELKLGLEFVLFYKLQRRPDVAGTMCDVRLTTLCHGFAHTHFRSNCFRFLFGEFGATGDT